MEPLKLALEWLKKNWIILAVAGAVAFLGWQHFVQKAMTDKMAEENRLQFERYTRDLQEMEEVHQRELAAQQEINQRLEQNLTRVENEYTTRMTELESRLRTRRQTFVRETAGNPEEMARRVRERLGWSGGTQ